MEQDQEIIKRLMAMLGKGKELKFKSPDGQTIKVSFQGSAFNQTLPSSEKSEQPSLPHQMELHSSEDSINPTSHEKLTRSHNSSNLNIIHEELEQMANDFNILSRIKEDDSVFSFANQDEDLNPFDLKQIEQISDNYTPSSKVEDELFQDFIFKPQHKDECSKKIKKIELSKKHAKKENENVINFFKDQQKNIDFNTNFVNEVQIPIVYSSSPIIFTQKQQIPELSNHKSETVKESINKLKELHPQSQKIVQIISERINQLEQIEKSISLINSSISNSLSLGFESFDVSMISFNKSLSDPLCHLMAQFIHKARQQVKSYQKGIPSSFLFLYSQPLIDSKGSQIQQQIDYFEQEQIVQKILKEGKCKVDYIHVPATVQKFHYWINEGVEIVHFCGHGIQSEENYLLFQKHLGQSQNVTVSRLSELLNEKKNSLKLVFVASCHSESAGKVFSQAGASHVICVRDEYQILDEACHQFVKLFYLSCINSKMTICEAFQLAKKQLFLKGRFTKHECEKFIIIRDHVTAKCKQHFEHRNQIQNFNDLNPRPDYNKYMLSRVEHYIPRSKEIYQIIQLINKKRRYLTIVGQSGLGKSTLVRELVRYIQFRSYFKDGIVYIELARCQTMDKVFQVLDLQFFETSQLKLNKGPSENCIRLAKEIGEKNLLIVFDNCQAIMASQDKQIFKKLTQILMKNCTNISFIFTNRYSISRQIDYCSEVLYQLGKLTQTQAKTLFFKKVPRQIRKKQYDQFFELDSNKQLTQISKHSFFQFLNGHPQAICLTASLLSERSLCQLHKMLLQPNISNQLNKGMDKQSNYKDGINRVVSTAMKISLNVIHHKYKDASEMIKILSLLPNGLQNEMMHKLFPSGGKWKQIVKRLINHSLIQCIEKSGCRYYLVHPQIITEVQSQIGLEEKIRLHQRICQQIVKRINKIYRYVGTSSQYSQRAQQLFLIEEDNFRALFLRQLNFIGEKYPLRKFYENLFKFEFQGLDEQEKNDFGQNKLSNAQILNMVEINKKKKNVQAEKNIQKKQAIDLIIIYYITIVFIIKKLKSSAIEAYLNYGFLISQKRNKYLVIANLLRLKACMYISQGNDVEAKQFFQLAHAQFAQLGCGLGSACCEAALGYIKLYESEYAPAKKNLENALKYYEQIPHPFGKHYLNRWLCSLKSKMNKQQKQLINHKLQAQKLLKETKLNLKSNNLNNTSFIKHKFGYFAFRFLFDNISLFLEATFEVDLKPKFINQQNIKKNNEKSNFILENIYNEEEQTPNQLPLKKKLRHEVKPQLYEVFKNDSNQQKSSLLPSLNRVYQNVQLDNSKKSIVTSKKQENVAKPMQSMNIISGNLSNNTSNFSFFQKANSLSNTTFNKNAKTSKPTKIKVTKKQQK